MGVAGCVLGGLKLMNDGFLIKAFVPWQQREKDGWIILKSSIMCDFFALDALLFLFMECEPENVFHHGLGGSVSILK